MSRSARTDWVVPTAVLASAAGGFGTASTLSAAEPSTNTISPRSIPSIITSRDWSSWNASTASVVARRPVVVDRHVVLSV